eukprot:TRINITY_DN13338_c0_g1_i1.p2 TRINITY_DN13338_c0_g1~~TRINITY_DN13338_c0_g1_i1.p2  ORF type:complete len:288 (+),score=82.18 TRINITY_DN13338_c0_g1_i1:63-866(+)
MPGGAGPKARRSGGRTRRVEPTKGPPVTLQSPFSGPDFTNYTNSGVGAGAKVPHSATQMVAERAVLQRLVRRLDREGGAPGEHTLGSLMRTKIPTDYHSLILSEAPPRAQPHVRDVVDGCEVHSPLHYSDISFVPVPAAVITAYAAVLVLAALATPAEGAPPVPVRAKPRKPAAAGWRPYVKDLMPLSPRFLTALARYQHPGDTVEAAEPARPASPGQRQRQRPPQKPAAAGRRLPKLLAKHRQKAEEEAPAHVPPLRTYMHLASFV